jgi:Na+/proline symporter
VIGVALFAYHRDHPLPPGGTFGRFDRLYPEYIARHFPSGLGGLVIAAIIAAAMSNLSAALNSLSSTAIMDFYRPHLAPNRSEAHYLWMSRVMTLVWAVVLSVIAYASRNSKSVLEAGLTIVSFPFSGLLGVFLLGTLTRAANETGALIGIIAGVSSAVALYKAHLPFTWFVVAGTVVTFVIGYAASIISQGRTEVGESPG